MSHVHASAGLCLLAGALAAQQFRPGLTLDVLDQLPFHTPGVALAADLDGDGLADLAFAVGSVPFQAPSFLYRNRGSHFEVVPTPGLPMPASSRVTAFDADGDGDLDLALNWGGLLRNDGAMQFVDNTATAMPATVPIGSSEASDIDGDGDLDLLTPQGGVLVNDGNGVFTDETATRLTTTIGSLGQRMAVADFDADGDDDFVIMRGLHRNDGAGHFTIDQAAGITHGYGDDPFVLDVDADGDFDVLLASGQLFVNDGSGHFAPAIAALPAQTNSGVIAVGDIDGDGLDDVVLGGSSTTALGWLANGGGTFATSPLAPLPTSMPQASAACLSDLDGDGDRDLVLTGANSSYPPTPAEVLYNDGQGRFHAATGTSNTRTNRSFRRFVVDLDGDGDDDILANGAVHLSDGRGGLTQTVWGVNGYALGVADFDGDGDLDIYGHDVWRNEGSLPFTFASSLANYVFAAQALDVDGDGDMDVLVATYNGTWSAMLNDGTGTTFTPASPASFGLPATRQTVMRAADIDGDGDDDLLFGGTGGFGGSPTPLALYRNGGAGTFSPAPMPASPWSISDLHVVDLDGDGDLDIVTESPNVASVFVQGPAGAFSTWQLPNVSNTGLCADDVDLDGDVDLWTRANGWYQIAINDGGNQFAVDASRVSTLRATHAPVDIVAIDLDLDGDREAVLAPQNSATNLQYHTVLWNHARQLRAPHLTRPGGALQMELSSLGLSPAPTFAIVGVSTASTSVQLPELGLLRIDPTQAVLVPVALVAGEAQANLPIPNLSGLFGFDLHAQAVFVSPQSLRLCNAVRNTIAH